MTKKHNIILQPSGSRGQADEGTSVRSAARELGVEIESICAENATCGKCMILVEEGRFEKYNIDSKRENLSPVGTAERAYLERRPKLLKDKGWEIGQVRLSCQCKILGDVLINVPEDSRGNKQIVRKSAFPVVHVVGVNQDSIPGALRPSKCPPPNGMVTGGAGSADEIARAAHNEEQECLFYVAMSRARDRLAFYGATTKSNGTSRPLSKFLARIGAASQRSRSRH